MAPTDAATAAPSATRVRQVIAPLTTAFSFPEECSMGFYRDSTTVGDSLYQSCSAYTTEQMCESSKKPSCYPKITADSDLKGGGYFFSPGLACPSSWVTAFTVTSGPGGKLASAVDMETLLPSETVAVCCPS